MNRVLIIFVFMFSFSTSSWGQGTVLRVGAFPNITHPQAMVGKANGSFEKALGPNVKIDWKSFNAGPSAIEALFSGAIDMTYIGPNPAITGYVRSQGEALRIVAQINLVSNFTGTGVVKSFYAPYFCPNCDREKVLLVETRDMAGKGPFKARSSRWRILTNSLCF